MDLKTIILTLLLTNIPSELRRSTDGRCYSGDLPENYVLAVSGTSSMDDVDYKLKGYQILPGRFGEDLGFCLLAEPEDTKRRTLVYADIGKDGVYEVYTCPDGRLVSRDSYEFEWVINIIRAINSSE